MHNSHDVRAALELPSRTCIIGNHKNCMSVAGHITLLPVEIHEKKVVQPAVGNDIEAIRRARLVSQDFARHVGAVVQTLCCGEGLDITPGAWSSYRNADGLRIDVSSVTAPDLPGLQQALARTFSLLHHAAPDRIRRFSFVAGAQAGWPGWGPLAGPVALLLCNANSTRRLQQLHVEAAIKAPEADVLLSGLSELEDACLIVEKLGLDDCWTPAAALKLRRLQLTGYPKERTGASLWLPIDLMGIASSRRLQRLELDHCLVQNCGALAALTELEHLSMKKGDGCVYSVEGLKPLQQLPNLHTLVLDNLACDAEEWEVLAEMQQLTRLEVALLDIGPGQPSASTSIRHLVSAGGMKTYMEDEEEGGQEPPLGLLQQMMPELQSLTASPDHPWLHAQVLALAGHSSLRSVKLVDDAGMFEDSLRWAERSLSSVPCLEEVEVQLMSLDAELAEILADAAGCSKLRRVVLKRNDMYAQVLGEHAVAALVGGACKQSLEMLSLQGASIPLATAVPLLKQLPALKEAVLELQWQRPALPADLPGEQRAAALYGQLVLLVQQAGCAVAPAAGPAVAQVGRVYKVPVPAMYKGLDTYRRVDEVVVMVEGTLLRCMLVERGTREQLGPGELEPQ